MNSDSSFILTASSIHKSYFIGKNELRVLRGVSLEVSPGESVSIMGASGSGKSTLLHVLGTLDRPDEGSVVFRGKDLYRMSAGQRVKIRSDDLGFVFQAYHLLPELDIVENTMLPAMSRPATTGQRREQRDQAMQLLDDVGLKDRAQHRPQELSGGEQQRVALARALMNNPAIILADEPTGNLDVRTGTQILEILFELTRGKDRSLVVVTHNETVASRCDRLLRLEDGLLKT